MHGLQISPVDKKDLINYENWFDLRGANYLLFKQSKHGPLADQDLKDVKVWTGSIAGDTVAVALYYQDETRRGFLDLAVRPSERRHGIGAEMTERILEEEALKNSPTVQVDVEPENTAAQKILHGAGFVHTGHNSEGWLVLVREKDHAKTDN